MLYQLSYIGLPYRKTLERETGIEPATNSLEGCDSTTELLPPFKTSYQLSAVNIQPKTLTVECYRSVHCFRSFLDPADEPTWKPQGHPE